jgi:K+-transporting ATPase c subunit
MAESETGEEPWLSLAEAGRRTGRHPDALRAMIRRGRLTGRKGNAGQWLVQVPTGLVSESDSAEDPDMAELREEVADLRVAVARAESERDSQTAERVRERETLQAVITDLRAERDRLTGELTEARKGWLERLLEAVRRR